MDGKPSGEGRGPGRPVAGQAGAGETADALAGGAGAEATAATRGLARSGALDTWLDRLEEAAMRDGDTRLRVQRALLANLTSIREDGGELYESWLDLLRGSLDDLRDVDSD